MIIVIIEGLGIVWYFCLFTTVNECYGPFTISHAASIEPMENSETGTAFIMRCEEGYSPSQATGNIVCSSSNMWTNIPSCNGESIHPSHVPYPPPSYLPPSVTPLPRPQATWSAAVVICGPISLAVMVSPSFLLYPPPSLSATLCHCNVMITLTQMRFNLKSNYIVRPY